MILYSHCKINLGLSVIARREDGFSDIETVMYPLRAMSDIVEMIPSDDFSFSNSGIAVDCPPEDNLCVKAYRAVTSRFGIKEQAKIHLHKNIPFGAGLGAGSANAVAVIKLCDTIYNIGMSSEDMLGLAGELGSDTPFFVDFKPVVARSRGEMMESVAVDLKGYCVVMVKPDVGVSTKDAYRAVTPAMPAVTPSQAIQQPIERWRSELKNDFEKPIFDALPILNTVKEKLYAAGAIYASLSGSGSTVYGIFKDQQTVKIDELICFNNFFLHTFTVE